jgi:protein involved in polysaccharide export with SLBB domain
MRGKLFKNICHFGVRCGAAAMALLLMAVPGRAQMGPAVGPGINSGMPGGPGAGGYAAPGGSAATGAYAVPGAYPTPGVYGAPGGYGAAGGYGTPAGYAIPGAYAQGPYPAPVTCAPQGTYAPAGSYGAAGTHGAPGAPAVGGYSGAGTTAPGTYGTPGPLAPGASAAAGPGISSPQNAMATLNSSAPAGGTATFPNGVNGSTLVASVSKLSPRQINDAMQALGISPNEALQLQQQLATGVISPAEVQSLCAHLASSNISPALIQTVAGTIGLNPSQLEQIQGCFPGGVGGQPRMTSPAGSQMQLPPCPPIPVSGAASPGPPSLIEQNYGQLDLQLPPPNPSPISLGQFGYSIFASTVSSFAPVANFPVGPDYVLGPGDQLNIYMWGRLNQTMTVMVDRDGSIEVSGIEPLQIGGLSLEQAKRLIEGRVSQISNVNVHVTMGPLRTIQVLVVGAVNQPGSYTISPMSRVSNALIAAGGMSKIGILRGVELRRGNQAIRLIDYYQLLLRGDNSDDLFLQTNDIVFVPPVGPVVGVVGDVQRPAIYELRRGATDARGAIQLAAGASPFSDTERVQVERVDRRRRLIVLDVPYGELGGRNFALHDGDLVKVFHMLTMHQDVVELTGNVRRPGEFQWRSNMRVSDLIAAGGGPAQHTSFKYAVLRRTTYPSMRQRFIQEISPMSCWETRTIPPT